MDGVRMFSGQEEYFQRLLVLVKEEISLYTKYAVRLKENGGIRHIYNTKLFRDELSNVMEDAFAHMDRRGKISLAGGAPSTGRRTAP